MKDLIEALMIFMKYDTSKCTGCEHDVLYVYIAPVKVSDEDIERLRKLGFHPSEDVDSFYSNRFGSA